MRKLFFPGIILVGFLIWLAMPLINNVIEKNETGKLRADACAVMGKTVGLSGAERKDCEEKDAGYLSALEKSADLISQKVAENINQVIETVNHNGRHGNEDSFRPMSFDDFAANYRMIGIAPEDQALNRTLDYKSVEVTGLRADFDTYEPETDLFYISVRYETAEGSEDILVAIDPHLNQRFDDSMGFTCYDIVAVEGGCKGTIYLRNTHDGISLTPVVVDLHLEPVSARQAKANVMAIFSPTFEKGHSEVDAQKMQSLIEAFTLEPTSGRSI